MAGTLDNTGGTGSTVSMVATRSLVVERAIRDGGRDVGIVPPVAVGVMAHNEAATIGACLRAVLDEPEASMITSVVVIASGCTDGTEDAVLDIAAGDARVRLVVEPVRRGKASAINRFLSAVDEPVCVLVGGDIVITPGCIRRLTAPLTGDEVGMTGGHAVPTNARRGMAGNVVHMLWELHHELALDEPKLGEIVAFRRLFDSIDAGTLVDEVSMELAVVDADHRLVYVPDAVVHNHGPETLRDFVAQRRRIHLGHLQIREADAYRPSTMGLSMVSRVALRHARAHPGRIGWLLLASTLEGLARVQAALRFRLGSGSGHGTWRPIASTKRLVEPGQFLRRHVDDVIDLRLLPGGDRAPSARQMRRTLRELARLLRVEDRVARSRGHLHLRVRTDLDGAAALAVRLDAVLPDWIVVHAGHGGSISRVRLAEGESA